MLCTVLQEPRLVAFYEKLGYKPIKSEPEQEGMYMVYMEKWILEPKKTFLLVSWITETFFILI
ncbi:GNAT family N-acetyltransferase [Streptococcus parasuis]|uniref:GNAT family N-acetyltransferase n=1 Tax=Streptococcus parasuis TaxID=1501662 RepID=UPI0028AD857A|nr:GNAT family N-acetyltransferase [Streptococcus parasuis]